MSEMNEFGGRKSPEKMLHINEMTRWRGVPLAAVEKYDGRPWEIAPCAMGIFAHGEAAPENRSGGGDSLRLPQKNAPGGGKQYAIKRARFFLENRALFILLFG